MEESGFLNIFKPPGMTSHDVVAYLRKRLKPRKIGHGGTLDPLACGVLVCLLNDATRRSAEFTGCSKTYVAEATFGVRTSTGDLGGDILENAPCALTENDILGVLPRFTGRIKQTPPMMSAVKVGGEKLYKLARRGVEVERKSREVEVSELKVVRFYIAGGRPKALFEISCSGGTYVRTLIEDIGAALDAPAVTSFLVRTSVGRFGIEDSISLRIAAETENALRYLKGDLPSDSIEGVEQ
ncbi:MAG TPA: tRNA pseudouridine(55) synthase TruB [bacterium]|nr:tRNA pseudouridine(55) synthase TruB [bacterium]